MMEKKFPAEAPPSLVIVVDEFAALVNEVPEFVDGVVNVAQRGRSLGLHMILATQQPSGVIKGPLRANTNLRLALRVADVDDSNDILGSTQAAFFDQDTPGRAVSKTGPGRLVAFQTGYVGGHSDQGAPRAEVKVEELTFGPGARWEKPEVEREVQPEQGAADIARIVDAVSEAFGSALLPQPRKPWLPDLARHYDLAHDIPTRRMDSELVFGMLDDPDHQQQLPVAFRPDVEGNLIVYGASGSGKTTFLRTIAVAAGFTVRGGPCHVYGLDFASGGLGMLEVLPHVGSIISGSDDERVQRFFKYLKGLLEERASAFKACDAATLVDYRRSANRPNEPRILVLLDGLPAFRAAHERAGKWQYIELLADLAARGRGFGLHFLMTSDQRSGLTTALGSSVQSRIVMRMADPDDYAALGVPASILSTDSPPGRAIVDGAEAQVGVLGRDADNHNQATALKAFGDSMQKVLIARPPAIGRLPEHVTLAQLVKQPGRLTLGMESEGFGPATIDPSGTFVVTGPISSGRSTALLTLTNELERCGYEVTVLADRRSTLTARVGARRAFVGVDAICAALPDLAQRFAAADSGRRAVVLEGMGELSGSDADYVLPDFLRTALSQDVFVIAEGEVTTLIQSYELMKRFKAGKTGLFLQPDESQSQVVGVELPRSSPASFVQGRGYLVTRGKLALVQVAEA